MRVALKGIDIEKHLKASRAAYEMSGEMSGTGPDENLQRNLDALGDVEKWACESHEICVGKYKGDGGGMTVEMTGGSSGSAELDAAADALKKNTMGVGGGAAVASLRDFVKTEVDAALKDLTMDFEIMESSMGGQLKALKNRVKALEEQIKKGGAAPTDGAYKSGGDAPAEEEVDDKDEM